MKCQCPKSGEPHFYYPIIKDGYWLVIECVNALSRANLISTERYYYGIPFSIPCVNALSRANLISTLQTRIVAIMVVFALCQCPKSGEPHFYKSFVNG